MENTLQVYNTISRQKEVFQPLKAPFVGMYVCGPTVYGDAHLGHARPAITFDLIYRYLQHIGYKVRYVRNITDVGHLENDADEGEDKIAKKARLEQLEPMEIAQYFSDRYHINMDQLNVLRPGIEPRASGHIIEQIEMVKKIIEKGYAYVVNGSVYFDVKKYNDSYNYGKLSGRILEDLLANTRALDGQDEKHNSFDFALWKNAQPEHIMRWPSPWGDGFPGWHMECSAMSAKYLGTHFDIHGGGMDLLFPHHESEIAQSQVSNGCEPCKYWLHNNMITINGQKMGKSLGNFITLDEFFSGKHASLDKAYSPMCIRFFILQAHYRSTLDFSNEALQAAEKGFKRLMQGVDTLQKLSISATSKSDIPKLTANCYEAMNDDFNSPIVIANLFEGLRIINAVNDGKESITAADLEILKNLYTTFIFDILGLKNETENNQFELLDGLMQMIFAFRQQAKTNKDYAASDKIRDELSRLGIAVKDGKDGSAWNIE
ncbi:MAG: cysteine--tRNA ligase [Bacteroidetes bacterium]|nr:cysteine--tRNA ligase [Bacteroidota bacterium]